MSKEWEKLHKSCTTLHKQLKKISLKSAETGKTSVQRAFKSAWAAEEVFSKAAAEAKKVNNGAKPAELVKDKSLKGPLADFRAKVAAHRKEVAELTKVCAAASDSEKEGRKLLDSAQKEVKKNKSLQTKGNQSFLKELEGLLTNARKTANVRGTLKGPEVLYGVNFDKLVQSLLKEKSEKPDRSAAAAEKLIEAKTRAANVKTALAALKDIQAVCQDAPGKPVKDAAADLKAAANTLAELTDLDKAYQAAKKSQAKQIGASKEKGKIVQAMNTIHKAAVKADGVHAGAVQEVKKLARQA